MRKIPRSSHGADLGCDLTVSFSCSNFAPLSREGPGHMVPCGLSQQDRGVMGRVVAQVSSPSQLNTKHSPSPDSELFFFFFFFLI